MISARTCQPYRAILLFGESDVLLGRRINVRDAYDRYANLKINYLRQRTLARRAARMGPITALRYE